MRILVFAPHNDDEVLGVGGTIAKYVAEGHEVFVCEVTSSADQERLNKVRNEAAQAHEILGIKKAFFLELPVIRLKDVSLFEMNSKILNVAKEVKPDIAYIPHKGDMNMDHYMVAHSAMVAMRPNGNLKVKEIYSYETLSETEWNIPSVENAFMPNTFIDITNYIDIKKIAMSCYKTQLFNPPHPRSLEIIEALGKLRGSTVGVGYAESFMLIRKIG